MTRSTKIYAHYYYGIGNAKDTRRGRSRISSKNQVTIPVDALREAGLTAGDRLIATVDGPGRLVLERDSDPLGLFIGVLTDA